MDRNEELWPAPRLPPEDESLNVPPRQDPRFRLPQVGDNRAKRGHDVLRVVCDPHPIEDAVTGERNGAVVLKHDVLGYRHSFNYTHFTPFLRDMAGARFDELAWRAVGHILAEQGYLPTRGRAQSADDLHQLGLAVSRNSGDAKDFTGVDEKRHPAQHRFSS